MEATYETLLADIRPGLQQQLEPEEKNKKMVTYIPVNDGWFHYFYCNGCGHKELHMPRKTCPHCGETILNAISIAPGPERAAREDEERQIIDDQ